MMSKAKHVPMRKCVGCRQLKPKSEMIRIVKSPEDVLSMDVVGKKSGRGAYVCKDPHCLSQAVKGKGFERSLKNRLDSDIYTNLEQEIHRSADE